MTDMEYWEMITDVCHMYSILAAFPLINVCKDIVYDCGRSLSNSSGTVYQRQECVGVEHINKFISCAMVAVIENVYIIIANQVTQFLLATYTFQ